MANDIYDDEGFPHEEKLKVGYHRYDSIFIGGIVDENLRKGYIVVDYSSGRYSVSGYDRLGLDQIFNHNYPSYDEAKIDFKKIKESLQHAIDNEYWNG